ncbi:MAG: hypothetical protein Q8R67_24655 [Rhodoferax sp.]|nr:hypothetical protein [Rhodoferax sp.]MDP3654864.1 hypothetical protein [Rhodoferax sp.]
MKISEFESAATAAGLKVLPGKSAVKSQYQTGIAVGPGLSFTASVDIDLDCQAAEPQSNRWDYGLGLKTKKGEEFAVWVEPHPASSTGEVAKIFAKLDWLERKLAQPDFKGLNTLTQKSAQADIPRFHWLAMTGDIRIRAGSREAALLSKRGLRLPSRHLVLS